MAYQEIFTALADPTRRQIFENLRDRPKTVGELAKGQTVSRPAVSQHLRVLQDAHLVSVEPQGNRRLYSIKREGLKELRDYLDCFWSDAFSAYRAEIAKVMEKKGKKLMLEPLVKAIDVPCDQATAFDVFINKMDSWWPLGKFTLSAMKGDPATGIRVDARPDGQIVELGAGGVETLWGTIKEYNPSDYLSMDFHIPAPGHEEVGERTLVEVRFTSLGDNSTRLELTQSNWEALGDMAEMVHGGYGHGWTMILEGGYLAHFAE